MQFAAQYLNQGRGIGSKVLWPSKMRGPLMVGAIFAYILFRARQAARLWNSFTLKNGSMTHNNCRPTHFSYVAGCGGWQSVKNNEKRHSEIFRVKKKIKIQRLVLTFGDGDGGGGVYRQFNRW